MQVVFASYSGVLFLPAVSGRGLLVDLKGEAARKHAKLMGHCLMTVRQKVIYITSAQ